MATVNDFRIMFPEFPIARFPDQMVTLWLTQARQFVSSDRWGDSYDLGCYLWLAHYMSLAGLDAKIAASGGNPGQAGGMMSSKSADGVSASYDVSALKEEGAGFWNQTRYGRQYYRFTQIFGAGPVQVGGGDAISVSAYWPGPYRVF